jgi:hypothetical protein
MNDGIIAHKGIITLEKATWDTTWGMYASFSLEQPPQLKSASNPFKKYTGMRKGKVGTIFAAVFSSIETGDIFFDDEVMLKGWSDGTTGWKVTFWFKEENDSHPFIGIAKDTEYALVLVELDDDSSAINQKKRDRLAAAPKGGRERKLSNYAAMLCRTPQFWGFLEAKSVRFDRFRKEGICSEVAAKQTMCLLLDIESRAELDTSEELAQKFHKLIRTPYAVWTGGQQNG